MTNSIPFFMFRMLVFPPMAGALTWFWLEIDFIRQLGAIDTIFFGGIFFSFAITMNTVNMRRFQAIDELAKIWSVALSFWNIGQLHLQKDKLGLFQQELQALFEKLRFFLHIDTVEEESKKRLADVDGFFGFLSKTIEEFRKDGLNSPELARLWGWHAEMYLAFEKLRAIKENRTPRALRVFIDWVLVLGVLLLTPQFASFGNYGIWISTIIMMVLLVLIKVQKMLEHPFGKDMDDIDLRLRNFASKRIVPLT